MSAITRISDIFTYPMSLHGSPTTAEGISCARMRRGSGTDQHLLIHDHCAAQVEADLIVLCVQLDSIRRIQRGHREALDRNSGEQILVPKPFFTLEDDDDLQLHDSPVPLERPVKIN